ncbi:MAG: hypothetical protein HFI26_08455 [Lachnospiraceae bacterium]|jgi:hypothetical protein|nr:hypothetical protein [Lachnospiraceae bacterium]
MSADDILKIIQGIPEYIKYIYPGYLTVYTYYFLRGKTLKDSNYILIKAIAISYLYIILIEWLGNISWISGVQNRIFSRASYEIKLNTSLLLVSIIFAYVAYRLVISKRLNWILGKLKVNTTFYDNEMEVLADFDKGAWLCVYLKDDEVVYEGSLGYKELEEDRRKYICLNAYYKYFLDKHGKPKEPYVEDHENEQEQTVLIFYDSIKRIEKRV